MKLNFYGMSEKNREVKGWLNLYSIKIKFHEIF